MARRPIGRSEPFEIEGVTLALRTDRLSYRPGETVAVTATACNPFDHPQTQTFAHRPAAEIRIDRDGQLVHSDENETTAPYQQTFGPRECKTHRLSWAAESGTYETYVLWWGHGAGASAEQTSRRPSRGWPSPSGSAGRARETNHDGKAQDRVVLTVDSADRDGVRITNRSV